MFQSIPRPLLLGPPACVVEGAPAALAAPVDEDGAHQVEHQAHGEHVQQRLLDHHAGQCVDMVGVMAFSE